MTDRLTVVSTDCHAGLPISQYKPYVDSKYHDFIDMAVEVQVDMMDK
ncbi:MAG: amidohydrolase, partial [Halieaceae bacterium]|nr:amidohydrolase [Halieaceae bacterium]